tara:strand:- start:3717 stop:6218 length:2502 start_codon:yes stop_codon:yes gene_type:complete
MPKELYKIEQFHGGLNSNSDPRDIADNELSAATDIVVDELGKIRLLGGTNSGTGIDARGNQINPGYGLFQFSHDRIDGHTIGSGVETGADYVAFSEADTVGTVDIYSQQDDTWGSPIGGMTSNVGGNLRKDVFYYEDGALRISDSDFGNANEPVWYGYVDRYFFGDGSTGYDGDSYDQGLRVNTWFKDNVAPKALPIKTFYGTGTATVPDISSPITIEIDNESVDVQTIATGGFIRDSVTAISIQVTFSASSPNVTVTTGGNTAPGLSRFCSIGDKILVTGAEDGDNNTIFTVSDVPEYGTDADPNTMDFEEAVLAEGSDAVYMYNLSKSEWFDPVNTGWEVAVSTLYDDSKQESALNVSSIVLQPSDIITGATGMDRLKIVPHVFAGDGSSTGLALIKSRVSGFKIYMRRQNTDVWYLQSEIDVTKGHKWYGRGDWEMWADAIESGMTACATCEGELLDRPREIETYESETGYDSSASGIGFDTTDTGFKTAVVANGIAYAGNVRIKDWKGNIETYGDAILKSAVGKYDSFTLERRIATSKADGDSIIKLEEYADRLLEFKKKKMSLINISQELEFLEDVFMFKGVTHPSAVCKTDYGIAWVNNQGCYLYDGQKVIDLLERDGRKLIKQSDWETFTTNTPMIGYIPKKRQLLVVDDNSSTGTQNVFIYDLVTRSWIEGYNNTFHSAALTNFVIDWNNDLIISSVSDTGTFYKWDDSADTSADMVISTKDIDFREPGQKKNVYKVIVTYQSGNATTNVQVDYGVDGDTSFSYDFTVPELPAANGWQTAELVPDVPSEAKNIKSIRLRFETDGTVPAAFEINDITICYRLKGKR